VALLGLACWGFSAWSLPTVVTDDRGVQTRFAAPPQRIVSALPSLTESVCALGACARLVGVDRYSNFPAEVNRLPKVGGGLDPSVEAIVALRPDVVLMAGSSRALARLSALGITVLALEPKNLADVRRTLGVLAAVLQVPDNLGPALEPALATAAAGLPPPARGLRVYFEVGSAYAAGPESFTGELLARLGARNIIDAGHGPFPQVNPEFVVRANPQVIMVGAAGALGMAQRPGWQRIDAVQQGRICRFNAQEADVLARPGPRLAQAAALMVQCLSGERR
jgi:iron complex transport system substrate-binding protein